MQFHKEEKIELFDFTSFFFAWTCFKFSGPICERSKILTEIVQATTFDHLNKTKENTNSSKKNDDDLSEYVTHLVKAKSTCEIRLEELG